MGRQYARGERAWGICGRSGRKMLLRDMVFDGRYPNMRVDPAWYEARHPLETLPMIDDPVALYRPSPEVNNAPAPPQVSLFAQGPTQINVTWTPAESGVTDIAAYAIYRSVNGGTFSLLATCTLERDFLGGITGITNATFPLYPERPGDPWATVPPDQSATYADTTVQTGFEYCYYVEALPMGNNQSVGQGPPVNSSTVCIQQVPLAPVLTGSYDFVGIAADLSWTLPGDWPASVVGFQIYRSAAGGPFSLLTTVSGSLLSYIDTTATDWRDGYQYYVIAEYAGGNSEPSNTAALPNQVTTTYVVSTTWQKPASAKYIRVRAIGGGQGGGSGNGSATPPNYGWGGCGGGFVDALFLPTAFTYPIAITIGQGGAGDDTTTGSSGDVGTDTILGADSVNNYVHALGGQGSQPNSTATGAQSFTQELGGHWITGEPTSGDTTNAGAGGGGANFFGTGNNRAGNCADGPGGDGGSSPGGIGAPYGGGGGGGEWRGGGQSGVTNGGPGANGVMLITVYT